MTYTTGGDITPSNAEPPVGVASVQRPVVAGAAIRTGTKNRIRAVADNLVRYRDRGHRGTAAAEATRRATAR